MKKLYSLFVLAALLLSYSCTHVIYFDKTPVEEPENELVVPEGATVIYYTTTDGKTIQAGVTKIPNVLSNTYKNGEGRIIIKGTLEEIPEKAFNNFTTLKSITLPNGVKTIGNNAFNGCNHLISVTIADSVTSIEYGAFQNCTSLTSVTIPDSVTSIGSHAFSFCTSLTSVTIPDSVTLIGNHAFSYCYSLASVFCESTTPPTAYVVEYNSWSAFYENAAYRKIYVPAESINIYKSAYAWKNYADAIKPYDFPETGSNKTEIPNNEIWYTTADGNIVNPYATDVFGASIVSNTYDAEKEHWVITFDGDVTSIGSDAFQNCTSLTSVTIPNGVTSIGGRSFNDCSSLESITISDSVTSIGEYAFSSCTSLISVTIPDSVTLIESYAFQNCTSLISVTIPDSVTSIGDCAFWCCYGLTNITIPDSVTVIGRNPFENCDNLTEFKGKIASEDGRCLIVDGVLNSFAPAGITSYNIPNSVTEIGDSAFENCFSLTSITIPDSVTKIRSYVFDSCISLTSVTIPHSVTSIGNYAFNHCDGLTSITIPDSVTEIGEYAFYDCRSLTGVTIPDSVTKIGIHAFDGCKSLASVFCECTTPPTANFEGYSSWGAFYRNAADRKIYVPRASVAAYKAAEGWKDYADAIEPYDF